jgi:hypothetical protein
MKPINTLLALLFISLLSSPSWSATMDDLVEREGIYYEKFTDVPFSGEITGDIQGSLKNGEKEGDWVWYHENGQLWMKENFKDGKKEGAWVSYDENGFLVSMLTGTFKDGTKISD